MVASPSGDPDFAPTGTLAAPPGPPSIGLSGSSQYPFLAPPLQPDEIGRLGLYRVLNVLGAGGMGVVFRAEDPSLRRHIALKVMLPQFASHPAAKARFIREARAQAAVEHNHIVAIYQVAEEREIAYITMPFLKGRSLADALKANPNVPVAEAVRIVREMAEGLAAAHENGLIHRDIKPANVWLEGRSRHVKILDFGLARTGDAGDDTVTEVGAIVGTPAYMSPEQAGGEQLDARTDLFSLGVVLYQMLAGRQPFTGKNSTAILVSVTAHNPPRPAELNPKVPADLDALTMRLLAKEPAERPPTAMAVIKALRSVEAERQGTAVIVVVATSPPPPHVDPWASVADTEVDMEPQPSARLAALAGITPPRRFPWLLAGALVVLLAVGVPATIFLTKKNGNETFKHADGSPIPVAKDVPVANNLDTPSLPGRQLIGEGWVDVLALNESWFRTSKSASWHKRDGKWISASVPDTPSQLDLPLAATGSYDLEIEATLDRGDNALTLILPFGKSATAFGVNQYQGTLAGLFEIQSVELASDENPTRTQQEPFQIGQRVKIAVSVRVKGDDATFSATVDGIKPVHWSGPVKHLGRPQITDAIPLDQFIVSAYASQYTLHVLRFKKLDGRAETMKPLSVE